MGIIFDIESNSKYFHKVSKVHCLCYNNIQDEHVYASVQLRDVEWDDYRKIYVFQIEDALDNLSKADLLIGHNIIGYDIPVLERMYTNWKHTNNTFDTHIASQLMFPDLYLLDIKRKWGSDAYHLLEDNKCLGKHSLRAWGFRLGILKGDFGETTDWQEYSPEMLEYCKQDVVVTKALYKYFMENIELLPIKAFQLEQQFQYCITKQEAHGILVDTKKAQEIVEFLKPKLDIVLEELQELFPEKIIGKKEFTPAKNDKSKGYVAGATFQRIEYQEFNPHAPQQVIDRLKELGWIPEHFTESGNPSTKEEHIKDFDHPSVKRLVFFKQIQNVITKLIGGKKKSEKSWLENIDEDGRLRHSVYAFGTNTRRCSHSPNVTQLPSNDYFDGTELEKILLPREIVIVPKGKVLVGADASALEARCLAHVINDTIFTQEILDKDIHTVNQELAGLETRAQAKTFYYGLLYGAGFAKLGLIVNGTSKDGERLRNTYYEKLPSLKILMDKLNKEVQSEGFITSIDGAKVPVPRDKSYISLNYLLQGAGAIVMKQAYVLAYQKISQIEGAHIVIFAHDELQCECFPEDADRVGQAIVDSIREAGEMLEFNCKLDGEYVVGGSWASTH